MEVRVSVHGSKPKASRVDPDAQIWAALLRHMRASKPDICRQWFDQLEPLGVSGGVLRVRAHSTIHRDYLRRACVGPFNESAQMATGRLISVRFLGPDESVDPAAAPSADGAAVRARAAPLRQGVQRGRAGRERRAGAAPQTVHRLCTANQRRETINRQGARPRRVRRVRAGGCVRTCGSLCPARRARFRRR